MVRQAKTHTCAICKEKLPALEALRYKDNKWYCKACFAEKANREWFSSQICLIFGIEAPGQRLWTDRKRLQNTYGYTDKVIIETLRYITEVKHIKLKVVSLGLVTPTMVDEMVAYKRNIKRTEEMLNNLVKKSNITNANRRIVNYHDADHPIKMPTRTSMSWDELKWEDDYEQEKPCFD